MLSSINKIDFNSVKLKKPIKNAQKVASNPIASVALKAGATSAYILRANLLSPLLINETDNKKEFYNLDSLTPSFNEEETNLINELISFSSEKGNHPYDTQKAQHLIGCLRSGEQRQYQIDALHKLLKNQKMQDGNDITKIVAQIKHLDKANFWVNQCEKLGKKYNNINSKELAEIVPKLKVNSIKKQEEAINSIYLRHKKNSNSLFLQKFGEYVSSVKNNELADKQFSFFDKLVNENDVPVFLWNLLLT